jgi:hypothetical protein
LKLPQSAYSTRATGIIVRCHFFLCLNRLSVVILSYNHLTDRVADDESEVLLANHKTPLMEKIVPVCDDRVGTQIKRLNDSTKIGSTISLIFNSV